MNLLLQFSEQYGSGLPRWAWQAFFVTETLSIYMLQAGWGLTDLLSYQILQAVVPIIPGALASIAEHILR